MLENIKALKDMYEILQTLISESHKSKTENISNIKMLFSTVRNRDSVENLEKQINLWNFFQHRNPEQMQFQDRCGQGQLINRYYLIPLQELTLTDAE